ncbi:NAD-dependent epimerase/dehydratase family protein [Candidatus Woesearchaeota archaeon]|nr:NAD-dependent epimerase/dehydratase family protein [Candidatus Woesearchaeota archaeon]
MNIIFTGGSGFIGLPIVKKLLDRGHHVRIIDLAKPEISHKNLDFVKKSILEDIHKDITGFDFLFHFAANIGVSFNDSHPLETMEVDLEGSAKVFKTAIKAGIKDMMYASSSEVYGNPRELPIKEDSIKGPVSSYGVAKLGSEIYANSYNQQFGANIKIVRFFNVYGPRQSIKFVVPIFITKALKNEPIPVYGDGSQARCYTYVDDAIDGALDVFDKGEKGGNYNIGNTHPTTVLQLAETIKEITKSSSEITVMGYGPETRLRKREVDYRIPSMEKMRTLGWEAKTRIREGAIKTADWIKKNL